MGYPLAQKAYKLLNQQTRIFFFLSRDVFVENSFPFQDVTCVSQPLFSPEMSILDDPLTDILPQITQNSDSTQNSQLIVLSSS